MRLLAALALLVSGCAACLPTVASASEVECYDAKVRAKAVAQIPTPYPRSDPDVIVMSWPWFVDLDVRRVIEGDVEKGRLETLAVLHSGYVRKTMTFYLRRNSALPIFCAMTLMHSSAARRMLCRPCLICDQARIELTRTSGERARNYIDEPMRMTIKDRHRIKSA